MAMAAAMMLLSCEKEETLTAKVNEPKDSLQAKTITFTFGEISHHVMTRGTLADASITDLWLFDYMGDELKQTGKEDTYNIEIAGYGDGYVEITDANGNTTVYAYAGDDTAKLKEAVKYATNVEKASAKPEN